MLCVDDLMALSDVNHHHHHGHSSCWSGKYCLPFGGGFGGFGGGGGHKGTLVHINRLENDLIDG